MATTEIEKTSAMSPVARNMIIGVITTIIVSLLVYLLGFSKKNSGPTKLDKEKATTEAWKGYVTIENIYTRTTALLLRDAVQFGSYKALFHEIKKESDKFLTGINNLTKNEDIDKDMIAVLKRRADNEQTTLGPSEKFFNELDDVIQLARTNAWTAQQISDTVMLRSKTFNDKAKGMIDRNIAEIESLSKTLSERYQQPFNIDDFFVVQIYKYKKDITSILHDEKKQVPVTNEYLIGKWDVSGATITFLADATWSWNVPANHTEAHGSWEIKNNQLIMHGKEATTGKKTDWIFDLSDADEKSFTMKLNVAPFNLYNPVRKE